VRTVFLFSTPRASPRPKRRNKNTGFPRGLCKVLVGGWIACGVERHALASELTVGHLEGLSSEVLFRPASVAGVLSNTPPVLFFFHGQGGRPTIEPVATCPASSNFVLVGLPYVALRAEPQTRDAYEQALRQEWDFLLRAREAVSRRLGLGPRSMLYVGGVSMGGWTAAALLERYPQELAGAVILLAGRMRTGHGSPPPGMRSRAVYIGSGETDPNLPAARRAASWYRTAGARVTFEVFTGCGHGVPPAPPLLDGWLAWEAVRNSPAQAGRTEFEEWWRSQRDALATRMDVWERYECLKRLRSDPRIAAIAPAELQWARELWAELQRDPRVRDDGAAEDELEAALQAEWKARTLVELMAVREQLDTIARTYSEHLAGRIARAEAEILAQATVRGVSNSPGKGAPGTNSIETPTSPLSRPRPLRVPPLRR
jgi:pimeloyl-ACP methyl ester carboxylesterase